MTRIPSILVVAAVLLLLYCAVLLTGDANDLAGNPDQLTVVALACGFSAFLPWADR